MRDLCTRRLAPQRLALGLLFLFGVSCALLPRPGAERSPRITSGGGSVFDVQQMFSVSVPGGARRLHLWLPMPNENDQWQEVREWRVDSAHPTQLVHDQYGNNFLLLLLDDPPPGRVTVDTTFHLQREEIRAEVEPELTRPHTPRELEALRSYLRESSQCVIDDRIQDMARRAAGDDPNPIRVSRRIFEAVLERVENHVKDPYPDSPKAWQPTGVGSSRRCFENCVGDSNDFHSLYAAVSRAAGIPTRVVYGSLLKLLLDGVEEDQGVHCWVEFHAPDVGWVPVDVAVADIFTADWQATEQSRPRVRLSVPGDFQGSDPARVEYYFGNLDSRRVSWHWNGDLVMTPPQEGPPLLWNTAGYAEIDGQSTPVRRRLTYRERTLADGPGPTSGSRSTSPAGR